MLRKQLESKFLIPLTFSRPKVELIYAKNYETVEEARSGIFEYIDVFYNRKRRYSSIDYLSPVEFEKKAALA